MRVERTGLTRRRKKCTAAGITHGRNGKRRSGCVHSLQTFPLLDSERNHSWRVPSNITHSSGPMKNLSTWQIGVKARKENQRTQSKWRQFLLCRQEAIAMKSTGNTWWLGDSLFSLSCETKNVSKAQLRELQKCEAWVLRTSCSVISWLPCLLSASLLPIIIFFVLFYFDNERQLFPATGC